MQLFGSTYFVVTFDLLTPRDPYPVGTSLIYLALHIQNAMKPGFISDCSEALRQLFEFHFLFHMTAPTVVSMETLLFTRSSPLNQFQLFQERPSNSRVPMLLCTRDLPCFRIGPSTEAGSGCAAGDR